jgi:hypothetical protein
MIDFKNFLVDCIIVGIGLGVGIADGILLLIPAYLIMRVIS